MKYFIWDNDKNEKLKRRRGISFEEIVFHIERGDMLDILEQPNQEKYQGQSFLVMKIEGHAYLVPYVEAEEGVILKTIIPGRKVTKRNSSEKHGNFQTGSGREEDPGIRGER